MIKFLSPFCLFLLSLSFAFAQTDTSTFYFPLKQGNLWQYKEPPPPDDPYIIETLIGRDTTFSNGITYASLITRNHGFTDTTGLKYLRQTDNKIYRYYPIQEMEHLTYDFSKDIGDTISIFLYSLGNDGFDTSIVTVEDMGIQNIFGERENIFLFIIDYLSAAYIGLIILPIVLA